MIIIFLLLQFLFHHLKSYHYSLQNVQKNVDNIWKYIKKIKLVIYLTNYLTTVLKLNASACVYEASVFRVQAPTIKKILKIFHS